MFMVALSVGEYDGELEAIVELTHRRAQVVAEERAERARASLQVGDQVTFSLDISPQYLRGVIGEVIGFDGNSVQVCLGRAIGRFRSGHIQCSPLRLVKLSS
jgi:hypothetical protein